MQHVRHAQVDGIEERIRLTVAHWLTSRNVVARSALETQQPQLLGDVPSLALGQDTTFELTVPVA